MNLISQDPVIHRTSGLERRSTQPSRQSGASGFTLLETTIAMLLLMIVAMGSAAMFSYSVYNNSGGSDRSASLAIAQQALEGLRNAPFNPTTTDPALDAGTIVQNGIVRDGRTFTLTRVVDDDPSTAAIDVIPTSTLKGITITVTAQSTGKGWASGTGGTVTLITRRAMAN